MLTLSEYFVMLDALRLECDGMTRIIAEILHRDGADYEVCMGMLTNDIGGIGFHMWISLPTGHIIDLRARMWLGDTAPHGVFIPDANHCYTAEYTEAGYPNHSIDRELFAFLAGATLESFPCLAELLPTPQPNDN